MKKILLVVVVLIASGLRLFQINQLSLTHDEMSIGYNAYSIVKTGKDEWGAKYPLVFRAFGDNKLPTYIYASVPSIALLGLNGFAVKLPSIIAGLAVVIGIFVITQQIFENWKMALLASFLMAINPWPIHLSRMAFESNLALAFFIFGMYFWLTLHTNTQLILHKQKKRLIGLILLFSLATYTYISYRLLIPILLSVYLALACTKLFKKKSTLKSVLQSESWKIATITLVGVAILLIPFFTSSGSNSNTSRFSQLFKDQLQGMHSLSTEQNNFCFLVEPKILPYLCRRLYSPSINLLNNIFVNYATFLSPTTIFIKGDKLEYLSVPNFPDILTVLLPFYWIGSVVWLQKNHRKYPMITWAWLLAPLPSALSGEPQIVRGSALLPFIILFTTLGIHYCWRKLRLQTTKLLLSPKKSLLIVGMYLILFTFCWVSFAINYYLIYPKQYRSHFYQLSQPVADYLWENQAKYEKIYITDDFPDAHIFLAFYGQVDPNWYQENVVRPPADDYSFQHPTQLGNFTFGPRLGDIVTNVNSSHWLYVTGPTDTIRYSKIFYGFSGVHGEVKITDVDLIREQIKSLNLN